MATASLIIAGLAPLKLHDPCPSPPESPINSSRGGTSDSPTSGGLDPSAVEAALHASVRQSRPSQIISSASQASGGVKMANVVQLRKVGVRGHGAPRSLMSTSQIRLHRSESRGFYQFSDTTSGTSEFDQNIQFDRDTSDF